MMLDVAALQHRVGVVEAALSQSGGPNAGGPAADRHKLQCIHELDRLAESLVGEPAPEAQEVKTRIQQLLMKASPRPDAMTYIEVYCHAFR